MKKKAFVILIGACVAALLLIVAGARSLHTASPDPYVAASWLAAALAFGVFVVMLAEYFMHGRQVHLYLGGTFLALSVMGVWSVLTIPLAVLPDAHDVLPDLMPVWTYLALWELQWITLALMLIVSIAADRRAVSRQQSVWRAVIVSTAAILWAAIAIFVTTTLPAVYRLFEAGGIGTAISLGCAVLFATACLAYNRASIHRDNAVLAWMAYGLVFAVFAQAAMLLHQPSEIVAAMQKQPYGAPMQFAGLMKVLTFLFPLIGMLAEHTRLLARLHEQSSETNNLIQI